MSRIRFTPVCVANLPGVGPLKSHFRNRFGKFGSIREDWDHKKALLCSKIPAENEKQKRSWALFTQIAEESTGGPQNHNF